MSMPPVPSHTQCDAMRDSSLNSTRTWLARGGISASIPSSFSTAR